MVPTSPADEYAAWVKANRFAANLTQQGLADKLGVSRRAVCSWEAGRIPSPRFREALAAFFKPPAEKEAA
jgi:transcriptional regulator with XRE-family HTH domain